MQDFGLQLIHTLNDLSMRFRPKFLVIHIRTQRSVSVRPPLCSCCCSCLISSLSSKPIVFFSYLPGQLYQMFGHEASRHIDYHRNSLFSEVTACLFSTGIFARNCIFIRVPISLAFIVLLFSLLRTTPFMIKLEGLHQFQSLLRIAQCKCRD